MKRQFAFTEKNLVLLVKYGTKILDYLSTGIAQPGKLQIFMTKRSVKNFFVWIKIIH